MPRNQNALTRRRFVQATAASSLALAGLGRPSFAQDKKPNIVFILADDLGYADVSCYGQRDYTTPNVDRLAIEGLKFTQGYWGRHITTPVADDAAAGMRCRKKRAPSDCRASDSELVVLMTTVRD
jgi:Sulfatase